MTGRVGKGRGGGLRSLRDEEGDGGRWAGGVRGRPEASGDLRGEGRVWPRGVQARPEGGGRWVGHPGGNLRGDQAGIHLAAVLRGESRGRRGKVRGAGPEFEEFGGEVGTVESGWGWGGEDVWAGGEQGISRVAGEVCTKGLEQKRGTLELGALEGTGGGECV